MGLRDLVVTSHRL